MTSYAPVGQLTGTFSRHVSLTDRLPWIYTVASLSSRIIAVSEGNHDAGLLGELALQLASSPASSLQTKARDLGLAQPGPPYVIVAARLPSGSDPAGFDGASASVRAQCAVTLQTKIAAHFIPGRPGWTDVSATESHPADPGSAIDRACEAIFYHTQSAIDGMSALARSIPLHLVLLDPYPVAAHETETMDAAVNEIEIELHKWMIGTLQATYGAGSWWSKGVPLTIRQGCMSRREEDGGDHSIAADAYMMFIDLVAIAKANWQLTGPFMERVAGKQGKDAATSWIGELNQIRKIFAHPIRGRYVKAPDGSRERVLDVRRRVLDACATFPIRAGDTDSNSETA